MSSRRPRFARTAELKKTLVFFDGPQVALLASDRSEYMLAVACERDGYEYAFFACEVSTNLLSSYLDEKCDLRYVFKKKEQSKQYYFFDWTEMSDMSVPVHRATIDDIQCDDYYPEPHYFARFHTREFTLRQSINTQEHVYGIDGKWDATDFSKFYGKMADLYAFLIVTTPSISAQLSDVDRALVKRAAGDYLWRGGGSYVGFYDRIFAQINIINPLAVAGINYHSPGKIKLRGNGDGISEVNNVIRSFKERIAENTALYRGIEKVLRNERLKKAPRDASFSSVSVENYVKSSADKLIVGLGLQNFEAVDDISGRNTLVYAKIALSFFRRSRDLYQFQAEGRITSSEAG